MVCNESGECARSNCGWQPRSPLPRRRRHRVHGAGSTPRSGCCLPISIKSMTLVKTCGSCARTARPISSGQTGSEDRRVCEEPRFSADQHCHEIQRRRHAVAPSPNRPRVPQVCSAPELPVPPMPTVPPDLNSASLFCFRTYTPARVCTICSRRDDQTARRLHGCNR